MTERSMATRFRTHTTAELLTAPGGDVVVCGFMAGRLNDRDPDFDVADGWGRARISIAPGSTAALKAARDLQPEDVVQVIGALKGDAPFAKGVKEVRATEIVVLSRAAALPVDPRRPGFEEKTPAAMRLAHRTFDLRRDEMQRRLRLSSRIRAVLRGALEAQGFVEIDTPILGRHLPGSQASFIVPTSGYQAFALSDTPQLYKQLLMAGGVDRYYQITRCFRDEGRYDATHQPEFAVLDLEMAWADDDDVYRAVDALMRAVHGKIVGHPLPARLPRLTFAEAMARYGSETPDLRFGLQIHDLTDRAAQSPSTLLQEACGPSDGPRGAALVMTVSGADLAAHQRRQGAQGGGDEAPPAGDASPAFTPWDGGVTELLADWPGVSHGWAEVKGDRLLGPMADALDPAGAAAVITDLGAIDGDRLLFLVGQHRPITQRAAGAAREHLGATLGLIPPGAFAPVWVYQIPYYGHQIQGDLFVPIRHPFTRPVDEDREALAALLSEEPPPAPPDDEQGVAFGDLLHLYADERARRRAAIRSRGFELSLNGQELATGSVRNHDKAVQQQIFDLLRYDAETVEARFGPLLKALDGGVPPHGGLSIGLDRLVALVAGVADVREVMAFPKDEAGRCRLTGAPTPVPAAELHALLGQEPQAPHSEAAEASEGAGPPPLRRPSPMAAFSFTHKEIRAGSPVLVVDRSESLRPLVAWLWECPELGLTTGERAPALTFPAPGDYTVILTVTDEGGAQASAGAMVSIPEEAPGDGDEAT